LLLEKLPFLLLAAGSCLITVAGNRAVGALVEGAAGFPLEIRLQNALFAYVRYLGKALWPVHLAVFYPYPDQFPPWRAAVCALVLLAVSALAIVNARRRPYLLVGWFWFLGVLVPFVGILQAGEQALADRFAYVPLIGLFLMIVWGLADWADRAPSPARSADRSAARSADIPVGLGHRGREADMNVGAPGGTVPGSKARTRSGAPSPQPSPPRRGRGSSDARLSPNRGVPDSRTDVREVSLSPSEGERAGVRGKTTSHWLWPCRYRGAWAGALAVAALVCCAGLSRRQTAYWQNSVTLFSHALAVTRDNARAHANLGSALAAAGQTEAAIEQFLETLRLNPDHAVAHWEVASCLAQLGRVDEALSHYETALRLKPDFPEALNNLAWLRATHPDPKYRDGAAAVELAERACRLTDRQEPMFIGTLAAAYAEAGRYDDAVKTAEEAKAKAAAAGQKELAEKNRHLLELYRARQPFHESR